MSVVYLGEADPLHRFDIENLAGRPVDEVEQLKTDGRITLAEYIAQLAIREGKQNPLASQLHDETIHHERKREEKKLVPNPDPQAGDWIETSCTLLEKAGILRANNRKGGRGQ